MDDQRTPAPDSRIDWIRADAREKADKDIRLALVTLRIQLALLAVLAVTAVTAGITSGSPVNGIFDAAIPAIWMWIGYGAGRRLASARAARREAEADIEISEATGPR